MDSSAAGVWYYSLVRHPSHVASSMPGGMAHMSEPALLPI